MSPLHVPLDFELCSFLEGYWSVCQTFDVQVYYLNLHLRLQA